MKVKSGFSAYAKNKIPLNHKSLPKTKENTDPNLGELLPNGFRVGEKIFYVSSIDSNRRYGTVIKHPEHPILHPATNVWADWVTSFGLDTGHMPLHLVFRV
jgi:hypothetical protein